MKVRSFFTFGLPVDGEVIELHIARMTIDQYSEFSNRLQSSATPFAEKFFARNVSGPEQDQKPNAEGELEYVIDFQKLAEQKREQLTGEELDKYEELEAADDREGREFLSWTFEHFVKVSKGLIEELPDGTDKTVIEGADLLRVFGARSDILLRILEAVRVENALPVDQKKDWKSRFDSSLSSTEPNQNQPGQKHETTAPDAETEVSALIEDALKKSKNPSGSTETLQPDLAPSSR